MNSLQQQARFDAFVQEFNTERPHEALAMMTPAEMYSASPTELGLAVARSRRRVIAETRWFRRPSPAAAPTTKGPFGPLFVGGEGGIRTRGGLLTLARFPGV